MKWLRWALLCCVLCGQAMADEIPGPTTPVPPVPTVDQIERALLTRYLELSVEKSELISEGNDIARWLITWEWMQDELAPGPLLDFLRIAVTQQRARFAEIESRIAEIERDMESLRRLLGW